MTPESLLKISSSSKFGGACSGVTLLLNFVSSSSFGFLGCLLKVTPVLHTAEAAAEVAAAGPAAAASG